MAGGSYDVSCIINWFLKFYTLETVSQKTCLTIADDPEGDNQ